MTSKRYYWLKLDEHFFKSNSIRILRRMPYGYRFIVMYIEMMLMAINTNGRLYISDGIAFDCETLSLVLDTEYELVEEAIDLYIKFGLMKKEGDILVIPDFDSVVGSETAEARKKRAYRQKAGDNSGTMSSYIDKDKEIEKEKDTEEEEEGEENACGNSFLSAPTLKNDFEGKPSYPTYEEIEAYANERSSNVNIDKFYDHYSAVGWMMGKTPIKDWKAAFRKWEQTEKEDNKSFGYQPGNNYSAKKEEPKKNSGSYDTDDFFEAALKRTYGDDYKYFLEN